MTPAPLSSANKQALARVNTLLTDFDDTLTVNGRLPAKVYEKLEELSAAGLSVVLITGRPAGWCDLIARCWPIAGVVGENGALAFRYDGQRMLRLHEDSAEVRETNQARLKRVGVEILREVPAAAISVDQPFRIADLAIDFAEDVGPLSDSDVQRIVSIFESHGATAKVSSIHVNGWFGAYDKLSMTKRFLSEALGRTLDDRCAFIGDSPNDEPMFGAIQLAVGVANIGTFLARMNKRPHYITNGHGGAGFVELAEALLGARA